MALIEERELREGGNVAIKLPGVRSGDMSKRTIKPEVTSQLMYCNYKLIFYQPRFVFCLCNSPLLANSGPRPPLKVSWFTLWTQELCLTLGIFKPILLLWESTTPLKTKIILMVCIFSLKRRTYFNPLLYCSTDNGDKNERSQPH